MPLSAPVARQHLHTRRVTCTGYFRDDGLFDIEGQITDEKTYEHDNEWRARRQINWCVGACPQSTGVGTEVGYVGEAILAELGCGAPAPKNTCQAPILAS